jgi:hypothetical protein
MAKQMLQLGSTKNNEDTLDLEYRPPKTPKIQMNLEHCLNKHLSGTINPKIRVEPICRTNPTIKGKVRAQDRKTATTNTTQASMIPGNIFTDGSRLETGEVGCIAVWLTNNGTWKKTPIPPRKKERNQRCRTLCDSQSPKNGKPISNQRQRNGHTTHLHRFDVSPEEHSRIDPNSRPMDH